MLGVRPLSWVAGVGVRFRAISRREHRQQRNDGAMIPLRKLGPIFLLGLALGLCAQTVQDRVVRISTALRDGNAEQAVQLADEALASFSNDPQLWTLEGIRLSAEKHTKQALDGYDHALAISPNYLPALEGAAQIDCYAGDKEAVTCCPRHAGFRFSMTRATRDSARAS